MLRRSSLAAFLASAFLACAHAPAQSVPERVVVPPPETLAPPGAAQPQPAEPAVPHADGAQAPASLPPVRTLELRLVKTFPDAVAPKSVALSPDGRWAAVMNLEGMEAWLIDTATLEIDRHIDFEPFKEPAEGFDYAKKKPIASFAQKPVEAVFSPDSRWLWFSLHNGASVVVYDLLEQDVVDAASPSYRAVIRDRTGSNRVWRLPRIPTGKTPKVVEITPDGKYLVVANWHSGSITVVDLATRTVAATIQSGASPGFVPRGLAISPDSRTAYVANMGGGTISTIDLAALKKVREDAITPNPRHLVLSRDGRTLYISENAGGVVLEYDLVDEKELGRSAVGSQTRTIALSHDERVLYAVSNEEGKLVALRAGDLSPLFATPFTAPMGVAVAPDDRRVWVTSYTGAGYVAVYDVVVDGEVPKS
jgi:YVTN family beta-propeller protein